MTFYFSNVLSHCFSQTFCFVPSHWCCYLALLLVLHVDTRASHWCWCFAWCQFFIFILLFPTLGLLFHVHAATSQCYYFVVMLLHRLVLLLHATSIAFSHCCCFILFMLLLRVVVVVSHLKQPMVNILLLLFCVGATIVVVSHLKQLMANTLLLLFRFGATFVSLVSISTSSPSYHVQVGAWSLKHQILDKAQGEFFFLFFHFFVSIFLSFCLSFFSFFC